MRRFGHFIEFDGSIDGIILASALVVFAPAAGGRQSPQVQQTPPLGTVAKQVRAEKQPVAPGKKVWTNDNLPTNPFAISVVGPPPPEEKPAKDETKPGEKNDEKSAAAAKETPKTLPEMEVELKKEQEALALQEKEVDLSKRDFALQQQAFYGNARANQDEAGQAQLAEVQKQLDAMQAELEKQRAKVAELQLQLDGMKKPAAPATGGDSGTPGGAA